MASLLEQLQQQEQASRAANLKRYDEAMQIYDEIIARYRPGGAFERATLSQLGKQKVRDVGEETHQLISSGLYGTTTMAGTGRRWEESVGQPARLKLEDIQMQRLSEAQIGKAGFIERREDIGPDYGQVAGLMSGIGQAPQPTGTTRTYGGTYGASSFPDQFSIAGEGGTAAPRTGYTGSTVTGTGPTPAEKLATAPADTTPTVSGEYGTYFGAGSTTSQLSERQRQIQAWGAIEAEKGRKLTSAERLKILQSGGV
jgi:hypothetical protein